MDTKNNTSKDDFNATSHKTDVLVAQLKYTKICIKINSVLNKKNKKELE